MIGRRAVTGLLLLCALVFCVAGASSASAAGMTAYECVSGASGGLGFKFTDADCETTNSGGSFGHKEITTEINTDSKLVSANYTLSTTLLTLPTAIVCTEQTSVGKVKNVAGPPMKAEGTATITFKGCTVEKPLKCLVKSPGAAPGVIIASAVTKSVIIKEAAPEEHGLEYSPNGANFTQLTFENKGEEKCPLNGKTFPVQGTIIGTGAVNSMVGGIQHFRKAEVPSMQKLTVGGEPATLEGETTITNATTNNALTLTTTAT